jgi:TRAP-type C4-dicarboxylate transport system permease small subunit
VICAVSWQVFGRYIMNNTPTWAESLALLLVLYVTMLGMAVGVRDAGHIGLESFLVLAPDGLRLKMEYLIHALVLVFGAAMAWNCACWPSRSGTTDCPRWASPKAGSTCRPRSGRRAGGAVLDGTPDRAGARREVEPSWH